ncbi:family 20 glycosylhydrolase [Croceivirga sp. JEA036]|uniref:family 20 glycosylhydrolase n=1 Tax=Croceivirga sp. JEA036 TaxID=2721162 RepID=UPI001439D576|nr:family 20 glycosylhydrolase [Croceivirga sp. JEA036]NJB37558.1 family 20 glycosylhydrolase [Croceivirga sp. JEA036]
MKSTILKSITIFSLLLALISCKEEKKKIEYPKTDLSVNALIPKPIKVIPTHTAFGLDSSTVIFTDQSATGFEAVGQFLANKIKEVTPLELGVNTSIDESVRRIIYITKTDSLAQDSPEAYELYIQNDTILLSARTAAGAFRGVQTLRQLIPEAANDTLSSSPMWLIPSGKIIDAPQYAYRGAMLDVARHFFTVAEVKRYLDQLAYYKINKFHLHLTDDQGWRIEIKSWPKLTTIGAKTEVGGTKGGFYTQEDYKEIVAYAAERHIEVIPEIDMPGHINAAVYSYPFLNGNGKSVNNYTGMRVGFSTLDTRKDTVYKFIDDVIGELAAISPSPYFHIGGDETFATKKKDYLHFINKVEAIVNQHGKQMMGWNEISQADISSNTIHQLWKEKHHSVDAAKKGAKIVLSPGNKSYLDMKYDANTKLGLTWAGFIPVDSAYQWRPSTFIKGLGKEHILGIEAPLWSETITNSDDLEYLAFPRVIGIAELGWTQEEFYDWESYKKRLGLQVPYLKRNSINYFNAQEVPWER